MLIIKGASLMAASPASSGTAWVTVLGVIGGATVSGIVAVLLAFLQRKTLGDQAAHQQQSQREQFQAQAAEAQHRWQLELRRGAYVGLLASVETLREKIGELGEHFGGSWPRRDGVPASETDELDALLAQFRERYDEAFRCGQLARLAGPQDMADAAQQVLEAMASLRNNADERVHSAKANARPVDASRWPDAVSEMHASVESFISRAAVILGSGAQPS